MKWFIKPETTRLLLEDGEWMDVKVRLTHGEREAMLKVSDYDPAKPTRTDIRTVIVDTYLVGWSLTQDGKPVPMSPDLPQNKRLATLRALSSEAFDAIHEAIDRHFMAMKAEDEAAKNVPSGAIESSAISPLPVSAAGDTTMS